MSQGPIDHPSYLTRQQFGLGKSTAGANGTSCSKAWPASNIRVRNVSALVVTAGTSSGAGHKALLQVIGTCTQNGVVGTGTTSLGQIALGSSTANTVSTSGDLNTIINQGSVLQSVNGTDATGVYDLTAEIYIDPLSSWTGN